MSNSSEKKIPKWLQITISIVTAIITALIAVFSIESCGNSKILLRNASNASISQKGSNIEVVVSTPISIDSLKVR